MDIKFGRYTNAFRGGIKNDLWKESEALYFDEIKYIDSYMKFFEYLKDEEVNNVEYERTGEEIKFIVKQGSKHIKGRIDATKITAVSEIAQMEKFSVPVMRKLLEHNYTLFYTKFALDNDRAILKFDSANKACQPEKLYYALRELALRGDKSDDLLISDFSALKPLNEHKIALSADVLDLKYIYFTKWINEVIAKANDKQITDKYSGAVSYMFLNMIYRIDYILHPEGALLNRLEKISSNYFAKDNKSLLEKIEIMKKGFEEILSLEKNKIFEGFYDVISTFGITNPTQHAAVQDTFKNNLQNVDYYINEKKEEYALVIFEYLAGYCLYSYGLPKPTRDLLHIVFVILNEDFFREAGVKELYYSGSAKTFDEKLLKERISKIIEEAKEDFPLADIKTENLKFSTLIAFLKSYINEINQLNYNKE